MDVPKRISLVLIFLASLTGTAFGQHPSATISGDFTNLKFKEVVPILEAQTHLKFYYDPSEIDTLKINVNAKTELIGTFLDKIFASTDFHYLISPDNKVFITKGVEILKGLPAGFFEINSANESAHTD